MARDSLSETERHCLESSTKSKIDVSNEISADKKATACDVKTPRVRFVDEETITERFVSTDEVDAVPKFKKVHILKNRSSSETSILLRAPSLTRQKLADRRASVDGAHLKSGDNLNNNTLSENLNGKIGGILKQNNNENDRLLIEKTENEKNNENSKETTSTNQNYKKNCNVYSVDQAKTIIAEKKKSLPLSNIPKLIGHRVNDNGLRSPSSPDAFGFDDAGLNKDFTARTIGKISRGIGKLLRRSNSVKISEPDPIYKVAYLGNVLTGWSRGENCVEKPLSTLWRNYNQSTKPDVVMKLSITNSGLKGATKEHGLTEYWSHRITYCASPPHYPKIFCWVYRHEGRKLKHELRCHAVLCSKEIIAKKITEELQLKLKQALSEFKKDKISKQNARLSLANSVYDNPTMPRRKILLSIGGNNYRPPLERSKSAPKLGAIEEMCSEEDEEEAELQNNTRCKTEFQLALAHRDDVITTNSRRRLTSEKVKSPRKYSLPEKVSRDMYRSLDIDKCEDHSFTEEVLDLLANQLNSSGKQLIGDITTTIETSRSDKRIDYLKKIEPTRCSLGSIDEVNEMSDSASPYKKVLEMLGQSSFVTDSDDGSVSSGCETASTTTSSDIEPSSLPARLPQEDFSIEKREREQETVQASELIYQRRFTSSISDLRSATEVEEERNSHMMISSGSAADLSSCYDICDVNRHPSEEVNCVPIGEKNFTRRSTYPPLKNVSEILTNYNQFDNLIDSLTNYELLGSSGENDVFKNSGDNMSACSDESGYSEISENCKESSIGSTFMV